MTARNDMEAATWAALAKHRRALADGTYRVTADNQLVDAILKAGDAYALGADIAKRQAQVNARALDEALNKIKAAS